MNKELLINGLSKLLEVSAEKLDENYVLEDSQLWDSLSVVSAIGLIDQNYYVAVKGDELEKCKTISDIFHLVSEKIERSNNIVKFPG